MRLGFARVLVEMDIEFVFPKEIEIAGVDRGRVIVSIEYPWLLVKCKKCKMFGHLSLTCTEVEKHVWLPKKVEPVKNLHVGPMVEKVAKLKNVVPNAMVEPKWNVVKAKKTLDSKNTINDSQSHWTNSFHLLVRADGNFKSGVKGSDTFLLFKMLLNLLWLRRVQKLKGKEKWVKRKRS